MAFGGVRPSMPMCCTSNSIHSCEVPAMTSLRISSLPWPARRCVGNGRSSYGERSAGHCTKLDFPQYTPTCPQQLPPVETHRDCVSCVPQETDLRRAEYAMDANNMSVSTIATRSQYITLPVLNAWWQIRSTDSTFVLHCFAFLCLPFFICVN